LSKKFFTSGIKCAILIAPTLGDLGAKQKTTGEPVALFWHYKFCGRCGQTGQIGMG